MVVLYDKSEDLLKTVFDQIETAFAENREGYQVININDLIVIVEDRMKEDERDVAASQLPEGDITGSGPMGHVCSRAAMELSY